MSRDRILVIPSLRSLDAHRAYMKLKQGYDLTQPELDLATPEELTQLRSALILLDDMRERLMNGAVPAVKRNGASEATYDIIKRSYKDMNKRQIDTGTSEELQSLIDNLRLVSALRDRYFDKRGL